MTQLCDVSCGDSRPYTLQEMATATRISNRTISRLDLSRRIGVALLLLAMIVSPLLLLHAIDKISPATHTDLMPRWVGARAAFAGKSPYSAEVLREIQIAYYGHPVRSGENLDPMPFAYPAPVILFIAPLTRLSWPTTGLVFLLIIVPLLILSLWLCVRSLGLDLRKSSTALIVLLAFFSWPVMWGLHLQQPTLVVAILLFAGLFLLNAGHEFAPGILLAMAAIKPQLVLPLLLWLVLWAAARRSWIFLASLAGALTLIWYETERIVPHWFTQWRESLRNYSGSTRSALPLEVMVGHRAGLALTAVLIVACGVTLWRLHRAAPGSQDFSVAVSLTLAGALNLVPTHVLIIYNDVLLFPAFLLVFFGKPVERVSWLVRFLALAIVGAEFAVMIVSGFGAASGHAVHVWTGLPFLEFPDDLLPLLLTMFLVIKGWQMQTADRVYGAAQPS